MANTLYVPVFRAFDDNGDPLAGGLVYTYEAGTNTPKATYTDATMTTPNSNPVVLDANGSAQIWTSGYYKINLTDANGVQQDDWPVDNWTNDSGEMGPAGTFQMATATGTPDAIEADYNPNITLSNLTTVGFVATGANTVTNPTFSPDGLTPHTITKNGGQPLVAGDIPGALAVCLVEYNAANTRWELLNPATSIIGNGTVTKAKLSTQVQNAVNAVNPTAQGRLTLTSNVPVTTSDVTAATTLYYTPFNGNKISLFNGTDWDALTFTQLSIAVPSTTNTMYDVFIYNNAGVATLELTAWTNDTTRTTALTTQDGIYVKSGGLTRRYVGTIRTTGVSGQTEDSTSGRKVWNYYNRTTRQLSVVDTTNSWNYTTNTWRQSNGSTANQFNCVVGIQDDLAEVDAMSIVGNTGGIFMAAAGVGINSTTVNSATLYGSVAGNNGGVTFKAQAHAKYKGYLPIGYNTIAWLEIAEASGTCTWYGDNNVTYLQSGMVATIRA